MFGSNAAARDEAVAVFETLLTAFFGYEPDALGLSIGKSLDAATGEASGDDDIAGVIERLVKLLGERRYVGQAVRILLRIMRPSWSCGAWDVLAYAPAFEKVKDGLLRGLATDVIDFSGLCAVLIGMYGQEAESVLDDLLQRLRAERTDCSVALPLTWAVYQIGGMRPAVREVLIEVARHDNSCPHAQPVAQRILEVNQVAY